jgi:hypothetical protein
MVIVQPLLSRLVGAGDVWFDPYPHWPLKEWSFRNPRAIRDITSRIECEPYVDSLPVACYNGAIEAEEAGETNSVRGRDRSKGQYVGAGVAFGAGIGTAIGAAMGNIAVGVAIGAGVGVAIGAALEQAKNRG